MSVLLRRQLVLETVQLEVISGLDGQGMPSFDSPVDLEARVVREDAVVRTPAGQDIKTTTTAWFDGEQDPLPNVDDRVTTADGSVGIVVERIDGKALQRGTLDHVRIRLREESQ